MKVVINVCYGGFSVSRAVYEAMGREWDGYGYDFIDSRTDPKLVEVIERLGNKANGSCANLHVVDIPDDATDWEISEYDGSEEILCVINGKIKHLW